MQRRCSGAAAVLQCATARAATVAQVVAWSLEIDVLEIDVLKIATPEIVPVVLRSPTDSEPLTVASPLTSSVNALTKPGTSSDSGEKLLALSVPPMLASPIVVRPPVTFASAAVSLPAVVTKPDTVNESVENDSAVSRPLIVASLAVIESADRLPEMVAWGPIGAHAVVGPQAHTA